MLANLDGTTQSTFRIGIGQQFIASNGIMQIKNPANTALDRLQVASPISNDDAVNKSFVEERIYLSWQQNGNVTVTTSVDGFRICPFAGTIEYVLMQVRQIGGAGGSGFNRINISKGSPGALIPGTQVNNTVLATLYPVVGDRPTINGIGGGGTVNSTLLAVLPSTTTVIANDIFTMDVTNRAQTPTAQDLSITLIIKRTR